jgi:F0F1-type ATP synthase assembly protein I
MKFLLAIVAYLVIGLLLGWGILLAVKGQPWLLIVGFLAYAVAFAKLGCLPKQSH